MTPRTKLALIQNTIIGIPVIVVISIFNGIEANASAMVHVLGSAIFGYTTSLVMLFITLKWFKVKSKFDQEARIAIQTIGKNTA